VVHSKDSKIPARLRIAPRWRSNRDAETGSLIPEGRLWDFTEKIASCRREGKNRRDGATVSTRVLKLTDTLGRKLLAEAKAPGKDYELSKEDKETLERSTRSRRRRRSLQASL